MNTATHTPTPYRVYASRRIMGPDSTYVGSATSEENAAFIVRACNAHDELVAALRNIAEYAEHDGTQVAAMASAALAKAGA